MDSNEELDPNEDSDSNKTMRSLKEMDSNIYLGYCTVKNTVRDRLEDDSLVHTFTYKLKLQKSTQVLNRELKKIIKKQSYRKFVDCKKKVLKILSSNEDVTEKSDFSDDDYERFYKDVDFSKMQTTTLENAADCFSWLFISKKDTPVTAESDNEIYYGINKKKNVNETSTSVKRKKVTSKVRNKSKSENINKKFSSVHNGPSKTLQSVYDDTFHNFTESDLQAQSTKIFSDTFSGTPKKKLRLSKNSPIYHSTDEPENFNEFISNIPYHFLSCLTNVTEENNCQDKKYKINENERFEMESQENKLETEQELEDSLKTDLKANKIIEEDLANRNKKPQIKESRILLTKINCKKPIKNNQDEINLQCEDSSESQNDYPESNIILQAQKNKKSSQPKQKTMKNLLHTEQESITCNLLSPEKNNKVEQHKKQISHVENQDKIQTSQKNEIDKPKDSNPNKKISSVKELNNFSISTDVSEKLNNHELEDALIAELKSSCELQNNSKLQNSQQPIEKQKSEKKKKNQDQSDETYFSNEELCVEKLSENKEPDFLGENEKNGVGLIHSSNTNLNDYAQEFIFEDFNNCGNKIHIKEHGIPLPNSKVSEKVNKIPLDIKCFSSKKDKSNVSVENSDNEDDCFEKLDSLKKNRKLDEQSKEKINQGKLMAMNVEEINNFKQNKKLHNNAEDIETLNNEKNDVSHKNQSSFSSDEEMVINDDYFNSGLVKRVNLQKKENIQNNPQLEKSYKEKLVESDEIKLTDKSFELKELIGSTKNKDFAKKKHSNKLESNNTSEHIIQETQESLNFRNNLSSQEMFSSIEDLTNDTNKNKADTSKKIETSCTQVPKTLQQKEVIEDKKIFKVSRIINWLDFTQ